MLQLISSRSLTGVGAHNVFVTLSPSALSYLGSRVRDKVYKFPVLQQLFGRTLTAISSCALRFRQQEPTMQVARGIGNPLH
jgi:hypothetical protein